MIRYYYQTVFKYVDFNFLPDVKTGFLKPFPSQTNKGDKICIMPEINRIMVICDGKSPRPYFWLNPLFLFTLHESYFAAKKGRIGEVSYNGGM